jgi:hypothetical protein
MFQGASESVQSAAYTFSAEYQRVFTACSESLDSAVWRYNWIQHSAHNVSRDSSPLLFLGTW